MTFNVDGVKAKIDALVEKIEHADDVESLKIASLEFAKSMRGYIAIFGTMQNEHEKHIRDLQSFAMQVKNKLEK